MNCVLTSTTPVTEPIVLPKPPLTKPGPAEPVPQPAKEPSPFAPPDWAKPGQETPPKQ